MNRRNSTGESDAGKIDTSLRVQAEARARRDKKPVDEDALNRNQIKAKLVQERENRDNRKRADSASELIAQLPPNARRVRIGGR